MSSDKHGASNDGQADGAGLTAPPRVSVGIPVRNGEATLVRALDSLLAQSLSDLEIVICDNASSDRTEEICRSYAERDRRVRYHRNEENIGQIANFNRVFELSRGEYFRWAGCNDWWEPTYLERCVAALEANPTAIMVSCIHEYHWGDGRIDCREYHGPRVDSSDAHTRFTRMLWFFRADPFFFDPIYCLMRSDALTKTQRLLFMLGADVALAAELSLMGPACHVPERLVFQHVTLSAPADVQLRRFDPSQSSAGMHLLRLHWVLARIVLEQHIGTWPTAACLVAVLQSYLFKKWRTMRDWARRTVALRSRFRALSSAVGRRPSVPQGDSRRV